MIRVLVVDDSPSMREMILAVLAGDPDLVVAGVATNGEDAVAKTLALQPDVITMDIRMPRMDGVAAIRAIMNAAPTPIVVLYSKRNNGALDVGFSALQAGALEVVEKPTLSSASEVRAFRSSFATLLKLMAEVKVVRLFGHEPADADSFFGHGDDALEIDAVGICSSTGGPAALERIFRHMPADFPAPIFVVQHIAEGFLEGFVEWLNVSSALPAEVAREGTAALAGRIYFAPDDRHLAVASGCIIRMSDAPPKRSHRPSGDVLLDSLASCFGGRSMGVVLTGMGEDGADGCETIARAGGVVLAQNEESSVVYGMPRAVAERGVADEVLALEDIPSRIVDWMHRGSRRDSELHEEG